jgi:predicted lactoylglutathione lyase
VVFASNVNAPAQRGVTITDHIPPVPFEPVTLNLQPMVHVADMHQAVVFYEALGARVLHGSRDGDFVLLAIGESQLSLLAHPPNPEQNEGKIELNFETAEPLADLERKLRAEGVTIVQPAAAAGFGEQLQIAAPDGLLVKINKLEPDRYG